MLPMVMRHVEKGHAKFLVHPHFLCILPMLMVNGDASKCQVGPLIKMQRGKEKKIIKEKKLKEVTWMYLA